MISGAIVSARNIQDISDGKELEAQVKDSWLIYSPGFSFIKKISKKCNKLKKITTHTIYVPIRIILIKLIKYKDTVIIFMNVLYLYSMTH